MFLVKKSRWTMKTITVQINTRLQALRTAEVLLAKGPRGLTGWRPRHLSWRFSQYHPNRSPSTQRGAGSSLTPSFRLSEAFAAPLFLLPPQSWWRHRTRRDLTLRCGSNSISTPLICFCQVGLELFIVGVHSCCPSPYISAHGSRSVIG